MMHRTAMVFGGSGGLGAGCVRALAADWGTVAITYRNSRESAVCLASELPESCTGFPVQCDTSDKASVDAAVDTVISQCGLIGSAVFAVGVAIDQPKIHAISEDVWRLVLETELLGFLRVLGKLLPIYREQGGGNFVAVTSMANTRVIAGDGLSAVPKAGIEILSRQIAKEEGRFNIRCNTVAPGAMNAGMGGEFIANRMSPEFWESFRGNIPMRKFGDASDIGEPVAFLASERAKYLTGQTLIADGGYTL